MPRRLAVVVGVAALGCGMTATPPSQEEMLARFRGDRATLESALAVVRGSPALVQRLPIRKTDDFAGWGIGSDSSRTLRQAFDALKLEWIGATRSGGLQFVTWVADLPGPGHHARGFAWSTERPQGEPKSPDRASFEEYVPIEGDWYVFELLID